ncbi:hypothetical protein EON67_00515, partial [archaeon]
MCVHVPPARAAHVPRCVRGSRRVRTAMAQLIRMVRDPRMRARDRMQAFIAGVGILSDAFNFFSINLVKNVMSNIYPQTSAQTSAIGTAALVGAVFGQVVFGSLADKLGRRTIFI